MTLTSAKQLTSSAPRSTKRYGCETLNTPIPNTSRSQYLTTYATHHASCINLSFKSPPLAAVDRCFKRLSLEFDQREMERHVNYSYSHEIHLNYRPDGTVIFNSPERVSTSTLDIGVLPFINGVDFWQAVILVADRQTSPFPTVDFSSKGSSLLLWNYLPVDLPTNQHLKLRQTLQVQKDY